MSSPKSPQLEHVMTTLWAYLLQQTYYSISLKSPHLQMSTGQT